MMSEANLKDIEYAGWNFVVGGKLPDIPYAIAEWHRLHPNTWLSPGGPGSLYLADEEGR